VSQVLKITGLSLQKLIKDNTVDDTPVSRPCRAPIQPF